MNTESGGKLLKAFVDPAIDCQRGEAMKLNKTRN